MADLQNFSLTRIANANVNVPRWSIECRVMNSSTGALIRDLTGVNGVIFPTILGQLTNAQQDQLVEQIVNWLIDRRMEQA